VASGAVRLAAVTQTELAPLVPPWDPGPDYAGFAVPLRLLTTIAHIGTALDVAVAELRLEAFLPGDAETAARLASASGPRRFESIATRGSL
jgi:hypothetical protein